MKSRVVWAVAIFFFLSAVVSFKEKIALYAVNKALDKYLPGSVFYAKEFSLWPWSASLKDFGIKNTKNASPALSFKGQKALFGFPFFYLNKAEVAILSLSYDALSLEDARVDLSRDKKTRLLVSPLDIRRLTYKKTVSRDIKGRFRIDAKTFYFDDIVAPVFKGIAQCSGSVVMTKDGVPLVTVVLQLEHIDLGDVMKFFEVEKRVQASGAYSGKINIFMKGGEITQIGGGLKSEGGGQCTIVDDSMLERNALSGNGLNIVVENLKDYHYDIGSAKIGSEGQNIKIELLLEGQAGKRQFEVVWHRSVI